MGHSGVDNSVAQPAEFVLQQNYPNPFNPVTNLRYVVGVVSGRSSVATNVRLAVFDMLGREVAVLVDEQKKPGTYTVEFEGSRFASGVYFYRLTAPGVSEVRRMLLMK